MAPSFDVVPGHRPRPRADGHAGWSRAEADAFYAGVLGFEVLPKPEPLASRGGRWFACDDVQVHLGVEDDFRPARKAHAAR